MTTTFETLRAMLVEDHALDPATLYPQTSLVDLGIDSLALIELIFSLEEHFGVAAENVPSDLPTLGSVADYIDGLLRARDAGGARAPIDLSPLAPRE